MNYPVWDVPIIGSGWVIGGIAIFHVMISHFAVGGGFYLPWAEWRATRAGRDDWMPIVRGHAKFFLILTSVFGAVSGVGIWFAIGLANPEATSTLIHNFVFGWAIEWTFFFIEITAAGAYYYTWDKVSGRTHLIIGWIYAFSAWMSLVVINGILTFMLTPGAAWLEVAGTGAEASRFWEAFFNPTYWPSLVLRTLICVSLAGIWALVTASRIPVEGERDLKSEVVRWSVGWLIPAFVLMPFAFAWYLYQVPQSRLDLLQLGVGTIGVGAFTQVTRLVLITIITSATIAVIAYFLAWRNPRDFTFGHAISLVFLALAATAATEQAREMLRKPYVVGEHMYSNSIRRSEVDGFNRDGYLTKSVWAMGIMAGDGTAAAPAAGEEEADAALALARERGELMFKGQCLACHTRDGYRGMKGLLAGRDLEAIGNILRMLHTPTEDSGYVAYMPPLVGSADEIGALGRYLESLAAK